MKKIILTCIIATLIIPINLLAYTGEIVKEFATPCNFPTGLTFDGKYLWLADRHDDVLICIDPESEKVIRRIESPAYWPMGLTWDGEALWNADIKGGIPLSENYAGKIYRINPADGSILKTIEAPTPSSRGLAWDGKYLWCVDNSSDKIFQFSTEDGTTIKEFKAPSSESRGITFDGKYLWISDRIRNEIYMVSPVDGSVIIITEAPGPYTRGIAFDGEFLWAVDYQTRKIYKLKVNDGEKFRKYKTKSYKVTFRHQIKNYGPGKLINADIHIAKPINRLNQEILSDISCEPKAYNLVTDKWGQKTAHFNIKNLSAGESYEAKMQVNLKTSCVRYFIYPEKVGTLKDIPSEIKSKYLEDNEKYQITHPVIKNAVKKAVGDEQNPYKIARNIFSYLIDNMYYEMVGGWNTAPTVLERGNGSCSEYTFVYIAMCRAAGLPARYVGSVVVRGDDASMDDVFHRWVEIYLPNYGWIPVDPSGGDRSSPRDQAQYFGFVSNRFLITTQSGGGSETLHWTYNSDESWSSEPKAFIVSDHFAEWEPVEEKK